MASECKNSKHLSSGSTCPPLKPGLLRIYSMHFCPFAQRTRMILSQKKVKHEIVNIHLKQKPEWYFEKNPLGKVPTLELNDKLMYESMITCDFLDDVYPDQPLYPADPWKKGMDKCLIEVFGAKVSGHYYQTYSKSKTVDEIDTIAENVRKGLDFFEEELKKRGTTFFFGERPGMLDYAIFPWIERFPVVQRVYSNFSILCRERFPCLSNYFANMLKDDGVRSTLNSDSDNLQFYKSVLDGNTNYDIGV